MRLRKATAGTITVELRLVDHATPILRRVAWKFLTLDGQWHVEFMNADRLRQPASRRPTPNKRSVQDDAWRDEVIRRWQRRRWGIQAQDRLVAELQAAFLPPLERLLSRLRRLRG
jgi:hypothetical protein